MAKPAVKIVGFSTCAFHAAAKSIAQRVHAVVPVATSCADVVSLPDAAAFRTWVNEQGLSSGTTSPVCTHGGLSIGGYAELRAWLADQVLVHWDESGLTTRATVVLLTLRKHLKSRWLGDSKLAFALEQVKVRVLCIDASGQDGCIWSDELGGGGGLASAAMGYGSLQWSAMINCVSDVAPANDQRRLIAAMSAAEAAGALVANGAKAHAAAAGKVAQHALLKRLGLSSPPSIVVTRSAGADLANAAVAAQLRFPLLLKPNAAGFGKGIVSFASVEDLRKQPADADCLRDAFGDDGLAMLQEQIAPKDGRVGRIFVLGGRVLCAVRALAMDFGKSGPSGCMADGRAAATAIAWDPPEVIKGEVARLAEAAGASWGSIEMMSPSGNEEEERLYFDINLSCMSTLPDPEIVSDPDCIWVKGFDPYTELARWVLEKLSCQRTDPDTPPCKSLRTNR